MARTIDDKVVAMSFETTKFQTGVSQTLTGLDKLKNALHFPDAGKGFSDIETAANKVHLTGASSAIDKLKSKLGFGREASEGLGQIDAAGNKVRLDGPSNAIDKLKSKLSFGRESGEAFASIEQASGKVTLSGLSHALDGITTKFSTMQAAAAVALGNISAKAASAGAQAVKSFTFGPIMDGLHEYETNLNSVQTILANTQASGAKLKDVNAALQNLNTYSDKTIYNFSQMAKNIGTFTAAGVDLKTSTQSIKGIANLAAVSGSNAEQASTAMYQLSQAIAAGRVGLMDWNSVVTAGMGGSVFQRALVRTAQNMGTLKDSAVQLSGPMKNVKIDGQSFRDSIMAKPGQKSWLTGDVLTKTLSQLSGDMTDAQLKAEGFSDAQIKAIQSQAQMAVHAATEVKTLSQLLSTTKEQIGSGWTNTWQLLFGDFGQAKTLFTGLSNAIGNFVGRSAKARNAVLKDWNDLGGRTMLIDGIKTAFQNVVAVLKPIKEAFRDIFPRKTGQDLLDLTQRFHNFAESLKASPETIDNLKRTFRGLFALLDIGKQIVGGILSGIGAMLGAVGKGSGGVLSFTGSIGDLLTALDLWLKKTGVIKTFFQGLGALLRVPITLIGHLGDAFNGLFGGGQKVGAGVSSSFSGIAGALKPGTDAIETATSAWDDFLGVIENAGVAFQPVLDSIRETFSNLSSTISEAIASNDWSNVFTVIQTGLIAGIFLTIKKALGSGLTVEFGTKGVLGNLSKTLDTLNGSLKAIQNNIKAKTMLTIAAAVGLLAASAVALSLVKPEKLAAAMTALTVGMGQLMAALFIMDKVGGKAGFLKAPVIAASLVGLAVAVDILTIAILALSQLSWEELAKGLAGVGGALLVISLAVRPLSTAGPQMLIAAAALIPLAIGLTLLSAAVKIFGSMKWGEMAKGLIGVSLALDLIALSARAIPPSILITGPALVAVGLALGLIAGAVKLMGSMDIATLAKGLGAITLALVAIGASTMLMSPLLPVTAAGLILVGIALTGIAGAIAIMGNLSMATLAKGIGGIAASLVVLAVGLNAMMVALPGAAALLVAATALTIFVPVLAIMGNMKFSTIAKGLGFIVASIVALALAGVVAAPGLLALAGALTLLGVGITLVGAGLYLMTSALVKLAGEGAKGIGVTLAAFTAFIAILPKVIVDFLKGLVEIIAAIAELAPKVAVSMAKILVTLLDVIIKAAPKVAEATVALITAMLTVLNQKAGDIIQAGWHLLLNFLKGIDDHIVEVANRAIDIVVKLISTLASRAGQLTQAGLDLLVGLLKGIANNLGKVVSAAGDVILSLVRGLINNIGKVASAGLDIVVKLVTTLANNAKRVIDAGVDLVIAIVKGIGNALGRVATAAVDTATRFIDRLSREIPKGADNMASAVIHMLNAMADVVRRREPEFIGAIANIGEAIVEGLATSIRRGVGDIKDALLSLIPGPLKKFAHKLGITSPSKVFYAFGSMVVQGLANGISENADTAAGAVDNLASSMVESFSSIPDQIQDLIDTEPVITPVLDLSNIQNGSQKMTDMMNVVPISAAASFKQGAIISAEQLAQAVQSEDIAPAPVQLNFEQNNTSPESLSPIQIYRQTKNLLAQAEGAIGSV
jgi:tape measure domain-containing protein